MWSLNYTFKSSKELSWNDTVDACVQTGHKGMSFSILFCYRNKCKWYKRRHKKHVGKNTFKVWS